MIDFEPNLDRIHFKATKNGKSETIKINEINSIVMAQDSFTVLTQNNNENERYFAKFFFSTPTVRFYKKFHVVNSGGTPTMTSYTRSTATSMTPVTTTRWTTSPSYYGTIELTMYQDGNTTYQLTNKNYISILSKAFADVPDLVQKIQNKKYKFKDFGKMLSEYKQQSAYRDK